MNNYLLYLFFLGSFVYPLQATLVNIYQLTLNAQQEVYLLGDRHTIASVTTEQEQLEFFNFFFAEALRTSMRCKVIVERPTPLVKMIDPSPRILADICRDIDTPALLSIEDGEIRCHSLAAHYLLLRYSPKSILISHTYSLGNTSCNLLQLTYTNVYQEYSYYTALMLQLYQALNNNPRAQNIAAQKLRDSTHALTVFQKTLEQLNLDSERTVATSIAELYTLYPDTAGTLCKTLADRIYKISAPLFELSLLHSIVTTPNQEKLVVITGNAHTDELLSCLCQLGYVAHPRFGDKESKLALQQHDLTCFYNLFFKKTPASRASNCIIA